MNKQEIRQVLQDICRDIFDDEYLNIRDDMSAADIEEWDSLNHINLLNAVEEEFGIQIELHEHQELKNLGDMMALIERKVR